ncbi:MAG: acyltransferase [Austwickia sp.]|nr:acyltransferase [Actinomycetota bacterium]MCB1253613.1 acyltransferase [Austwickia sp.]MCO5309480.1 acyltransferase [Austwickia sp.]
MVSATQGPVVAGGGRPPGNAFGLLRLVMAALVIVSHGFPIGGFGEDPMYGWFREQTDLGGVAVLGFFAISGYLITRSGSSSAVVPFLWRRALRILPAFWVVLVVVAGIFGPISYAATYGRLDGYWTMDGGGPLAYVTRNSGVLITEYGIKGVFVGSPYGAGAGVDVVNGSLWSLFFEVLCYLGVAAAIVLGLLRGRRRFVVAALTVTLALLLVLQPVVPIFGRVVDVLTLGAAGPDLYLAFACGGMAALFPSRVRWQTWLAVVAGAVTLGTLLLGGFKGLGTVALSYGVLAAAHLLPAWARRIGAVNDVSYGIYIYAWPVAMLLEQCGFARAGYLPYLAATAVLTLALAVGSWVLVERPAMRLKSRGPGARRNRPAGVALRGPGATPRAMT